MASPRRGRRRLRSAPDIGVGGVTGEVRLAVEATARRAFACALDWPGWARSGKSEAEAVEALRRTGERFALVAAEAGLPEPSADHLRVVERTPGNATTDFGAPGMVFAADREAFTPAEAGRLAAVLGAVWRILDRSVEAAPAELRKGPRGGGRDRDAILAHVLQAEAAYLRKINLRIPLPDPADTRALAAFRQQVLTAISTVTDTIAVGWSWPPRYAVRRIAWHALDHAWEIEDRSPT